MGEPSLDIVVGLKCTPARVRESDLRGYALLGIIGKGTSATVYECESDDDDHVYAMKIQKHSQDASVEAERAEMFSDMGVAPRYIESWSNGQLSFLVTDKWDGSMKHFGLETLPSPLVFKLAVCIKRLHEEGYVHADVMPKNVLVKMRKGQPVDVTLTDFGLVRQADEWKDYDMKFIKNMHDYYSHANNPTSAFMKRNAISLAYLQEHPFCADLAFLDYLKRKQTKNVAVSTSAAAIDEQSGGAECEELRVPKPKGW